ncbi:hypothetical protein M427DRAFT_60718 [Gonapodya prolifera JEL478]|uniref:Uncharacterized protein n=1 Tax=Gonapodya prolifera (strain JEL478) TaxID=1344416 RepID=A0A139A532_GONPJ|nr:hypothetical protein M427DRAFT_60718 [Gonapodya prolifera JEL478]|eukprot:KXS11493.1 hypothetical protein M427DRAFT_60718 [Gonapodya prolifera JEL478]
MKEALRLRASTARTTDDTNSNQSQVIDDRRLLVQNAIDGFGGYEAFRAMTELQCRRILNLVRDLLTKFKWSSAFIGHRTGPALAERDPNDCGDS